MQQVDPALVVDVLRREVLEADGSVKRRIRPAHARDNVAAQADRVRHIRPDLEHAAEVLVADDQEVVARRSRAVLAGVDLLVGAVDADAQDLDPDATSIGYGVEGRKRDVLEVNRVALPREDRDRLHDAIVSAEAPAVTVARVAAMPSVEERRLVDALRAGDERALRRR